ncbi:hypothetical protein [Halalkalibacter flavus]
MENTNNNGTIFTGLMWGTVLSIPLWLSFIGWMKWLRLFFI